ncbi:hypothetical protein SAPIO_CDS0249 [Scedosporium apiospermum]|uniref:CFEM domain-containing protein n=1 Tax=Pseudallescheria apiosperma TaxID=563466 RepID=A0A084GHU7_PSEDA|nr:uncharacterized protein SAPIO_CDS0249 [Scedosporium apiospermum]KEZ46909.1 hypothetical protein SAPIO_CDS0249 [Scedosporium apiospermum]
MKLTTALILAAGAVGIHAQDVSSLPPCGQVCIQNMIGKAGEFGCQSTDVACLCRSRDFVYGIRDCSVESCSSSAEQVIQYGVDFCRSQGIEVSTDGEGGATNASPTDTAATNTAGTDTAGTTTETPATETTTPSPATETATETATTPTTTGEATETATATEGTTTEGGGATATQGPGNTGGAQQSSAPAGLLVAAGILALLV